MLACLGRDRAGKVEESDLRRFEKQLLPELGYGLCLDHDQDGLPVDPLANYTYRIEHGPVRVGRDEAAQPLVRGKTLLDLAAEDFSDPRSRKEAKQLMRVLINYYLSGTELETRKIFKELLEP
jgi:DNA repair protein RecO (recombination protein O)